MTSQFTNWKYSRIQTSVSCQKERLVIIWCLQNCIIVYKGKPTLKLKFAHLNNLCSLFFTIVYCVLEIQKGKQNFVWSRHIPFSSKESCIKWPESSGLGANADCGSYSTLLAIYEYILLVGCWLKITAHAIFWS